MKTKLEMAHEYAIALINSDCEMQFDKFIRLCWNYADAMQAEADKREKEETCDKSLNIDSKELSIEEWQPDWSQAPDNALTWAINSDGYASWALYKDGHYFSTVQAPSFGYHSNWRESLRKRPK